MGFPDCYFGDATRDGGVVPEYDFFEYVFSKEIDCSQSCDARAAPPVEERAGARFEPSLLEGFQGAVPLPADPGCEGFMVVEEVFLALPVDTGVAAFG